MDKKCSDKHMNKNFEGGKRQAGQGSCLNGMLIQTLSLELGMALSGVAINLHKVPGSIPTLGKHSLQETLPLRSHSSCWESCLKNNDKQARSIGIRLGDLVWVAVRTWFALGEGIAWEVIWLNLRKHCAKIVVTNDTQVELMVDP